MALFYNPIIIISVVIIIISIGVAKANTIPPIFIFGDSTTDVGTNNYLAVKGARADFPFNGIDYGDGIPTGRFSNGYNIADTIARLFGHRRSPPPFVAMLQKENMPHLKRNLLWGANFASGGAGLLHFTGKQFGGVITMREQVEQFATACSNITQLMGEESGKRIISNSVVIISIGSNDIFDYLLHNATHDIHNFISTAIQTYHSHLTKLVNLGARRYGIINVPPVGCIPRYRVTSITGDCVVELNSYAQIFSEKLEHLLQNLSMQFKDMKYSLGNSLEVIADIIDNHLAYGFTDVKTACCGYGVIGAESPCLPNASICQNRDEFFWWDRYHPSQAGYQVLALTLFAGAPRYVKPINFSQLVLDPI